MIDLFDNKESEYEEDDFMVVPEAIKEKIFSVILEKLRPALLDHFKKKCENFKFLGIAAEHISYEFLCSCRGPLKPAFLQNHQIDLYLMERYIYYSNYEYPYIDGKICVGAAIRLSDWIGNQECAAELKEIVQDFFTPHELPDPKTLVPSYWQ